MGREIHDLLVDDNQCLGVLFMPITRISKKGKSPAPPKRKSEEQIKAELQSADIVTYFEGKKKSFKEGSDHAFVFLFVELDSLRVTERWCLEWHMYPLNMNSNYVVIQDANIGVFTCDRLTGELMNTSRHYKDFEKFNRFYGWDARPICQFCVEGSGSNTSCNMFNQGSHLELRLCNQLIIRDNGFVHDAHVVQDQLFVVTQDKKVVEQYDLGKLSTYHNGTILPYPYRTTPCFPETYSWNFSAVLHGRFVPGMKRAALARINQLHFLDLLSGEIQRTCLEVRQQLYVSDGKWFIWVDPQDHLMAIEFR